MFYGVLKINKIIFYLTTSASKMEGTLHLNLIFLGGKIPSKVCVGKSYYLPILYVNTLT